MPTTVENRVVEMEFDNKRFEANVKETMTSLEKLKAALSFKGVKTGFEEIESSAKKFNLAPMEKSIESVQGGFSTLEKLATGALFKIGADAVDVGKKITNALAIEPLTQGWNKYSEKTQAVQRIVNATGLSVDEVNEKLDKLNWYTDETSFNFLDMVNNIGKFTANAVDLDTAVTAMQGISNWAGISGASVQEAGRAMYNLSQAIAVGSVKLMDWKSIENANMATAEFKQTVIDTAVELGELKKGEDGLLRTSKNHVVSAKNFNSALSDSWFTSEVLLKSLERYGSFTNQLYEATEETGLSASELLSAIEAFKNGTLDLSAYSDNLETTVEDTYKIIEDLADGSNDFGKKAFRASQEAKTFTEAIDATKDAVSSGWMKTYELIFGNYKEAVKLWTAVANILWKIFASGGDERNEVLGFWKELGRPALLDAVANGFMAVHNALKPIKEAFKEIFFPFEDNKSVAEWLVALTEKFRDFTAGLGLSEGAASDIKDAFKGLFTLIKQVIEETVKLIKKGKPIYDLFGKVIRFVIALTGYLGRLAQKQNLVVKGFELIFKVLKGGLTVLGMAVAGIVTLVTKIIQLVSYLNQLGVFKVITTPLQVLAAGVIYLYESIRKLLSLNVKGIPDFIKKADNAIKGLIDRLKQYEVIRKTLNIISNFFALVGAGLTKIGQWGQAVFDFFKQIADLVKEGKWGGAFTLVSDKLKEIRDTVKDLIVNGIFGGFKDKDGNVDDADSKLSKFNETLAKFRENISVGKIVAIGFAISMLTLASAVTRASNAAADTLVTFSGIFTNFNKIMRSLAARTAPVRQIAEAIAIVAASMALLSKMPKEGLEDALKYVLIITAAIGGLSIIMTLISRGRMKSDFRDFSDNMKSIMFAMITLAGGALILSSALLVLQRLTIDENILKRIGVLITVMGALAVMGIFLAKFAPKMTAGGLVLVLYSLSVKKIVDALVDIGSVPIDGLQDKITALISLMAGLGILALGMGNIRISSVLGILLLAATFKKVVPVFREDIVPAISELLDRFTEFSRKFMTVIAQIVGVDEAVKVFNHQVTAMSATLIAMITVFGTVTAVIAVFGKTLKNIGKAVAYASIGLSIFLLSIGGLLAIIEKNNITMDNLKTVQGLVMGILGMLTLMLTIASIFSGTKGKIKGQEFLLGGEKSPMEQFAKMMKAMGFFFTSLMAFVAVMTVVASGKNAASFERAMDLVYGVLGLLAAIVLAASFTKEHGAEVLSSLKTIAIATVLMTGLAIVLSLISPEDLGRALAAIGVIGLVMAALVAVTNLSQKSFHKQDIKKTIVSMTYTVMVISSLGLVIGGVIALALLMERSGGPMNVLAAAASIALVCLGIVRILEVTKGLKVTDKPAKTLMAVALVLSAVTLPLVAIVALMNFSKDTGATNLAIAAYALSLVSIMVAIGKFLNGIQELFSNIESTKNRIKMLYALTALIAAITIPFAVIVGVAKDAGTLIAAAASVTLLILTLSGVLLFMTKLEEMSKGSSMLKTAGAMALISVSLIVIAKSLQMLSEYPWEHMNDAVMAMVKVVLALGLVLAAIAAIGIATGGIGLAAVAVAAAAIIGLGYAVKTAGEGLALGVPAMENLIPVLQKLKSVGIVQVGKDLKTLNDPIKSLGEAGRYLEAGSTGLYVGLGAISDACKTLSECDTETILTAITDFIASMGSMSSDIADLGDSLPAFAKGIEKLGKAVGDLTYSGLNAALGLAAGIDVAIATDVPQEAARRLADAFLDAFREEVGEHSPWESTENSGNYAVLGLVKGVAALAPMAIFSGTAMGGNFIFGLNGTGGFNIVNGQSKAVEETVETAQETMETTVEENSEKTEKAGESWVTKFWDGVKNGWDKFKNWFKDNVADYDPSDFGGITGLFSGRWDAVSNISKTLDELKDAFSEGGLTGVLGLLGEKIDGVTESIGGAQGLLTQLFGVNGAAEEFDLILGDGSDASNSYADAIAAASEALDSYGDSASQAKNFTEELTETIQSQMDIFSEFNSQTEISGEQMLSNMASQVSGVRQWSENLQYLAQRGIDDGLLKSLTEMGPAGYEKVAAFVNMTDEQLAMASQLFRDSLSLPSSTAGAVSKDWWTTGAQSAKSYSKGLGSNEAKEETEEAAEDMVDAAVDAAAKEAEEEMPKAADAAKVAYLDWFHKPRVKQEIKKVFGQVGEEAVQATEDSVVDGENSSGKSMADSADKAVEEYVKESKDATEKATIEKPGLFESIREGWRKFWERAFEGLSHSNEIMAVEHVQSYTSTVLAAIANPTTSFHFQRRTSNLWNSFGSIVTSNMPTLSPMVAPVLDTSSFTQDTSKFSALLDADYSKYLSGSATMTITPDSALVAALEDIGDNTDVVEEIKTLKGSMADMAKAMSSMQVVLDSSVLVGEMVGPMDQALGSKAIRSRRERA